MGDADVLQSITDQDIIKLRELYKGPLPRSCYMYNYLECVIRWKTLYPDKRHYITILAPHGNWSTGTFVAIHQCFCYEVVMCTLENDCTALCQAVIDTKRIKWNNKLLLFAVNDSHYATILEALEKTTFRFHGAIKCGVWWKPKEEAIKFDLSCPSEAYVAKLNKSHAPLINSHWPHNYDDSAAYIATIIELNGGYGVFLKSNDKLVAWVLRSMLGLGVLQTLEDYKRQGYGSLVTRTLSQHIAEKGVDPIGTVLEHNTVSQGLFKKLGFKMVETILFVESKEMRGY